MARTWNQWVDDYDRYYQRMTQENQARLYESLLIKSSAELERIARDKAEPGIVSALAYSILKVHETGNFEKIDKVLNRIIGRPKDTLQIIGAPNGNKPAKNFNEFCERAGYPLPYLKQIEMMQFGIQQSGVKMILGSRGYGKTDYVVILGIAWDLFENPHRTYLLITKSEQRNAAILAEIAKALQANGVEGFEKQSSRDLRLGNTKGKDHSVSALSIGSSSLRGRHPDKIIFDDPVTEEDTSPAVRRRAERVYSEAMKLSNDILIIGQPVHRFDLYESLRSIINKLEVPHGSIPELDHDIEAMKLAGVSEASISASYHLKVLAENGNPLANINYIDTFSKDDSIAFIDPSFEGGDYTAMTVLKGHFDGVAVYGKVWKRAWFDLLDEIYDVVIEKGVLKLGFETNCLGEQPIRLLREMFDDVEVVGKKSVGPKHSRIMALGPFAKLIFLARDSDRIYIDQTVQYEYNAEYDDAPDSLASCLEWAGLIKGRL